MASELDVELEPKRMKKLWEISTSVHRLEVDQLLRTTNHHLPSKNPSNKLKTFPCAPTYPWPDPADSHALIPQVPWIPGSCHTPMGLTNGHVPGVPIG